MLLPQDLIVSLQNVTFVGPQGNQLSVDVVVTTPVLPIIELVIEPVSASGQLEILASFGSLGVTGFQFQLVDDTLQPLVVNTEDIELIPDSNIDVFFSMNTIFGNPLLGASLMLPVLSPFLSISLDTFEEGQEFCVVEPIFTDSIGNSLDVSTACSFILVELDVVLQVFPIQNSILRIIIDSEEETITGFQFSVSIQDESMMDVEFEIVEASIVSPELMGFGIASNGNNVLGFTTSFEGGIPPGTSELEIELEVGLEVG